MSGKLFAFNVSKKVERVDEKAGDQWVGDQTARASNYSYCSGSSYGVDGCIDGATVGYQCHPYGSQGFYICDAYPG
jgi:hypothetical protein